MNPASKHLLVQAGLFCLLILISFTKLELKSKAQISCVQPPLMHGDFVFWDSWPKGTNVTVLRISVSPCCEYKGNYRC